MELASGRRAGRRDKLCLPGLLGGRQADLDEVERADEALRDPEAARARDRVAERHGPVVLEEHERCRRIVRDLLELGIDIGELDEIGRASCRERVLVTV